MDGDTSMFQSFHNTQIGVMELNVFSDQCDRHFLVRRAQRLDHCLPVRKIRLGTRQMKGLTDNLSQMLPFHRQRRLVEIFHIKILKNMGTRNITEQSDFVADLLRQRMFRTADNHIRPQTESLQFLNACLGRLCLHFAGGFQVGDQGDMNQHSIFMSDLMLKLANRFEKRLALNIAHRAADLDDGDPVLGRNSGRSGS